MAIPSGSTTGNLTPMNAPLPTFSANNVDDLIMQEWIRTNTYHHNDFEIHILAKQVETKNLQITVIIPSREVANTIAGVLNHTVKPLVDAKIVNKVIVIDANSKDGTGAVAAMNGATVLQRADIAPAYGPSKGKGDAMWRALLATSPLDGSNEIVAFMDGDTMDPSLPHLLGIVGPMIMHDDLQLVKGTFERPFKYGEDKSAVRASDGGRVTELAARPLLNIFFPDLAGFRQPLAGFFAARRDLLEKLAFPVGYGIEIGSLIDSWRLVGLQALAQSDLGTWQNDHKTLRDLAPMAFIVASTINRRRQAVENQPQSSEKLYLPWKDEFAFVSHEERPPIRLYKHITNLAISGLTMTSNTQPFVKIDGVLNIRDVGGYPTANGKVIKRGLIYRSGDLKGLTEDGKVALEKLGVSHIFDLRSLGEAQKAQSAGGEKALSAWKTQPSGPVYHMVPIFNDVDYTPEALAERFRDYASEGTEGFERAYESILLHAAPALREIFDTLADATGDSAILINCTAGKDRTGLITMILLLLAGCTPEDVAKDYALTEQGLGPAWRADAVHRLSQQAVFKGQAITGIQRMVGAREEVMLAVIKNLKSEWGSVEGYLSSLGLDRQKVKACKAALTAEK